MNEALVTAKDGETWPFLARMTHSERSMIGLVYWPFAAREDFLREEWAVMHLPSGYRVADVRTLRSARALIRALRAAGLDYSFTAPKGKKWQAAREPMQAIVRRYEQRAVRS